MKMEINGNGMPPFDMLTLLLGHYMQNTKSNVVNKSALTNALYKSKKKYPKFLKNFDFYEKDHGLYSETTETALIDLRDTGYASKPGPDGNFDLNVNNLSKKYNREFKSQLKGSDLEKMTEGFIKELQKNSNSNP